MMKSRTSAHREPLSSHRKPLLSHREPLLGFRQKITGKQYVNGYQNQCGGGHGVTAVELLEGYPNF